MTILGLAESFKTMNRPDRNGLFLGRYKDRDMKFGHNLHSSLQFVLTKFRINIFNSWITALFGNVSISVIFSS